MVSNRICSHAECFVHSFSWQTEVQTAWCHQCKGLCDHIRLALSSRIKFKHLACVHRASIHQHSTYRRATHQVWKMSTPAAPAAPSHTLNCFGAVDARLPVPDLHGMGGVLLPLPLSRPTGWHAALHTYRSYPYDAGDEKTLNGEVLVVALRPWLGTDTATSRPHKRLHIDDLTRTRKIQGPRQMPTLNWPCWTQNSDAEPPPTTSRASSSSSSSSSEKKSWPSPKDWVLRGAPNFTGHALLRTETRLLYLFLFGRQLRRSNFSTARNTAAVLPYFPDGLEVGWGMTLAFAQECASHD